MFVWAILLDILCILSLQSFSSIDYRGAISFQIYLSEIIIFQLDVKGRNLSPPRYFKGEILWQDFCFVLIRNHIIFGALALAKLLVYEMSAYCVTTFNYTLSVLTSSSLKLYSFDVILCFAFLISIKASVCFLY